MIRNSLFRFLSSWRSPLRQSRNNHVQEHPLLHDRRPLPAPATAATQATVALPTSKIAIINSQEFMDAKTGILKFTTVVNKLNGEFQKARDDLNALRIAVKLSRPRLEAS